MASESEINEVQSVLERLINSRNRDFSFFIPFLLGFNSGQTRSESDQTTTDPDHNSENPSSTDDQRDRIILINPLTQGIVVIEGTGLDTLFRGVPEKDGPPPASKSSIEAMPCVEIREGDEGECVICLEEWVKGGIVKETPCKHKFHGGCIEKWLGMHGSCPVCRFAMPVEEDDVAKKGEERESGGERRRGQREIWVSFSIGSRRRTEEESVTVNGSNLSDSDNQSGSNSDGDGNESQMEN